MLRQGSINSYLPADDGQCLRVAAVGLLHAEREHETPRNAEDRRDVPVGYASSGGTYCVETACQSR
jgi:hypothetical protein